MRRTVKCIFYLHRTFLPKYTNEWKTFVRLFIFVSEFGSCVLLVSILPTRTTTSSERKQPTALMILIVFEQTNSQPDWMAARSVSIYVAHFLSLQSSQLGFSHRSVRIGTSCVCVLCIWIGLPICWRTNTTKTSWIFMVLFYLFAHWIQNWIDYWDTYDISYQQPCWHVHNHTSYFYLVEDPETSAQ